MFLENFAPPTLTFNTLILDSVALVELIEQIATAVDKNKIK